MNFEKSDKVWEWLKKHQVAFSDKKKESGSGLSDRTVDKYQTDFQRAMNMIEERTGKSDPMKVKPNDMYDLYNDLMNEFKEGKTEHASFLRSLDDSLHAFKEASKASGVYKREIRLGDKRKLSEMMSENEVFRKAKFTTVLAADRAAKDKVIDQLRMMQSETNNQRKKDAIETTINVLNLEFATGRRISAILRSKADNYDKETGRYVTYGDKGGKNNTSFFLTSEARDILDELTAGKNDGSPMFTIKYSNHHPDKNKRGQDKSVEAMRKEISALIKSAAYEAGVNYEEAKFSSHSCRKGFAEERAIDYLEMGEEAARKELERRRRLDPNLDARIEKVMENIKSKFKIKANAAKREFTHKEVVQLLVSTDINHSRKDVMRYYLTTEFWDSVQNYLNK